MFGLTEDSKSHVRVGKSRGVVLVRPAPRRSSWLSGWTHEPASGEEPSTERPPSPPPLPITPRKDRNRP